MPLFISKSFCYFIYRDVIYSSPVDAMIDPTLSGYCMETLCYNNATTNSTFTPDQCDPSYCTEETVVPTVPDNDNLHWFFDFALYIGGTIHFVMSLVTIISYFLINGRNFVLPDFFYQYMYVKVNVVYKLCIICRLQVGRASTYSDEPLFGIRSIYHIVRTSYSAML